MNNLVQTINNESIKRLSLSLLLSPKVAKAISSLLLLIMAYLIAAFSWSAWGYLQPRKDIVISSSNKAQSKKQTSKSSVKSITQYHLFGDTQAIEAVEESNELDAPVTRLELKLRGVYAASEDQLAGAMIEAKNKQEVYRVGSKLPGASGLKLHKILSDRVIMSRGGKFETLLIDNFGKPASSNIKTSSKYTSSRQTVANQPKKNNVIDKRNDTRLSSELIKLRSKLTDPQSLRELVSISPVMNGDNFEGFRISPGKNRALFGRMGLRRNDVVTAVNGMSLNDPSSAFSLMEQFTTADEIDLAIKRGDREMNILFSAQSQ